MRRKRRKKFKKFNFRLDSKWSWRGSLIFCCLILLTGLGYAIYTSGVFKIKEEDIKSNISLSRGLKERIKGKSLFEVDIKSISSALLRLHPEYKEIYAQRVFPSSLVIKGTKRIPVAQIKGRKFYPVDKEAIILSDGSLQPLDNLILLEAGDYSRGLKKGSNIRGKKLECAFDLIDALGREYIFSAGEVSLINASHLEAVYFIFIQKGSKSKSRVRDEGVKIIVGKGDFGRKLKVFKDLISRKLAGRLSSVKYIDLRFKKVYMDFRR